MATYSSIKYNFTPPAATTSAQVGAGAMTLIKSIDSDGSDATIDFVDGASSVVLDNTYKTYIFKLINIHPEDDNALLTFQGSTDTGSSYGVTMTSGAFYAYHNEGDGTTTLSYTTDDLAQSTDFFKFVGATGNGNDECSSGELWLFNPSSTTFEKHFLSRNNYYYGGDFSIERITGGYFNTTSAVDAIQFKYSDGEIQGGTIKLYGIA